MFLVLSGAALAHIHFHAPIGLPSGAGGALGEILGDIARKTLNVQGSTLMFISMFLIGLTAFTDLSWFKVMDVTGKITLDLIEIFQGAANSWWSTRVNEVVDTSTIDLRKKRKSKEPLIASDQDLRQNIFGREKQLAPVISDRT